MEELISVNFQVSECYCEFYTPVHTGFSLDVAGNTPTFQCKAAVSSMRKLLRVHSKFENPVNRTTRININHININPYDYYNPVIDYYNLVIDYYNTVIDYCNPLLRFEPCLNQLGSILIRLILILY